MTAWADASGGKGKVLFLSDGNAEFTKKIGMDFDGSGVGLGTRSKRYSMLVDDGVVKVLDVEDSPGVADLSTAAHAAQADLVTRPRSQLFSPRSGMNGAMPSRASSSARSLSSWP